MIASAMMTNSSLYVLCLKHILTYFFGLTSSEWTGCYSTLFSLSVRTGTVLAFTLTPCLLT